ncbi:hypothetical protein FOZ63_000117 [Perkinsus olseni]|uniref:Uncharacterized protein n=1 Tax=Perkinsus olseni TaxID=32597 RepID=A0A7J6TAN8_PEROL|nr:hypothetical protein FOZ62_000579 [Perkinsus olseni]KAF4752189.1 hypothetical protein FOZ63_000117 [Perkinsus olseni]
MMKFCHPGLMCISILMLGSKAEKAGRFMHTSAGLHIIVDVSKWLNVGFIFEPVSRDGFFIPERTHPLRETVGTSHIIDASPSELCHWYNEMEKLSPEVLLRAADLVTLTFEDFESLTVQFQGQNVRFRRVTYDLVPGRFIYTNDGQVEIAFQITSDSKVSMNASCGEMPLVRLTM